jgi:hypothetical protein
MRFLWQTMLLAVVLSATIFHSPAGSQTAGQGPIRTVLALGRVQSLADAPMQFKLSRVSIPSGATALYRGHASTLYLLSGALTTTNNEEFRTRRPRLSMHANAAFADCVPYHGSKKVVRRTISSTPLRTREKGLEAAVSGLAFASGGERATDCRTPHVTGLGSRWPRWKRRRIVPVQPDSFSPLFSARPR